MNGRGASRADLIIVSGGSHMSEGTVAIQSTATIIANPSAIEAAAAARLADLKTSGKPAAEGTMSMGDFPVLGTDFQGRHRQLLWCAVFV